MTDKQIIDKCPISEKCKEFENCKIQNILQQLQAKEQECEELKEQCKKYGKINEQETKDYAEFKAENEELRDLNTRLDNQRETYWKEYQKLKQTLTEIKEIAQLACEKSICDKNHCDYCSDGRIIKICEVIDD